MYAMPKPLLCVLCIIAIMRKNKSLPGEPDIERLEALFARLKEHPKTSQSKRVEKILGLLGDLRDDLSTPEKIRVNAGLRSALSHYRWANHVAPTLEGFRVVASPADRGTLSKDDEWG